MNRAIRRLLQLREFGRYWVRNGITSKGRPRIIANSMPKAGTNLLKKVLQSLPDFRQTLSWTSQGVHFDIGPYLGITEWNGEQQLILDGAIKGLKPGAFITSHLYYFAEVSKTLANKHVKTILLFRDPRDVCVSDMYFILKNPKHRLHSYLHGLNDESGQLTACIAGVDSSELDGQSPSLDIGTHYRFFLPWLNVPTNLTVFFENLVGPKGGGSTKKQISEIRRIAAHAESKCDEEGIAKIAATVFSPRSSTFRKGQIGDWKNYFDKAHINIFKEIAGDVLIELGYESSLDW